MLSTEFLLTSLVVVLAPGTGVIYTVTMGILSGRKSSVAAAVGCTAGIVPHLLAAIFGLSAIMHMGSLAFQVIRWTGAIYLLYLAWSMWRESGVLKFDAGDTKKSCRQIAVRGVLINIFNPKLSIFFLAFLPLFVSPSESSPVAQLLRLSAVFMGMTLIIFILYGLSATAVRNWVTHSPRRMVWLQRSIAALFAAMGAKLALSQN
ncbi:MAG: LysE family translocator [Desulfobacteraceae bacterium]|jgi:threonine/homoserine/homoserine lactone efflux protein